MKKVKARNIFITGMILLGFLTGCGIQGEPGKDGVNGVDGKDGADGQDGKDGTSIYTGSGKPELGLGKTGDLYIDSDSGDLYSKDESGWIKTGNVKNARDGVSVVNTHIDENGDLICEMSDGTTINAGHVKDVTKHTVDFYFDDKLVYTTTVEDGTKVAEPDETCLSGYIVDRWDFYDYSYVTHKYMGREWLFDIYTVTSDLELHAGAWTNKCTLTLDPGMGILESTTYICGYYWDYSLPTPTIPTLDVSEGLSYYYTFEGWYLENTLIPLSGIWEYSNTGGTLVAKYNKVDCVKYGIYPQTRVSGEDLISALNALTTPEPNGWYLYDGNYYAKKVKDKIYWFKCEPITWDILFSDNGTYSLVSTKLLDACRYYSSEDTRTVDGKTIYPSNYKYSDIRTWLNEDFYNTAFSLGDSYIQTTEVDNGASTTMSSTNKYACENTYDKVYLLSYQDYMNGNYFADDAARECETTDYAMANRCEGRWYWTRSPYDDFFIHDINRGNCGSTAGFDNSNVGVRPAITIKF